MPLSAENEIEIEDEKLQNALGCLRTLKNKQKPNKKSLLLDGGDEKLFLEVSFKRIPKTDHILSLKLNLKHPFITDPKNICLIVKGCDKNSRNFEEENFHWQEFLNKHDISVGEIIPYKQLTVEYKTYEAKRNLCHGFDLFLVDGRLSSLMPCALGKTFVKKRKMPYAINMSEGKIKQGFKRALTKTTMNVTGCGNLSACQVGCLGQSDQKLMDNIKEVIKSLSLKLPGSSENVHSLNLKMPLSESIPIYMAFHSVSKVVMPKLKNEKGAVEDEVNTLVRSKAKVYPSGNIKLIPEEVVDLLELEEAKLPIENHLLALQDIEKWKKRMGLKNVSEDEVVQMLKKKEGQRKRTVEKVKLKAELQEANFKEAKALKAVQIDKKNKKLQKVGLNPFTSEGEKLLKKSFRERKVEEIGEEPKVEEIEEEPKIAKWKKKNKMKKLKKKLKFEAKKELSENSVNTENEHGTVSLQKEKVEKLMLMLDPSKPISKNKKKKLLRYGNLTPEQISIIKATPVQKFGQRSQLVLENKETNGNIEKKHHKNKKAKDISNENEVSTLEKKKPTLSIMRLGSMKKKSYKLDKQNMVQNRQGDPTLLSIKTDVILESPSKLPINVSPVNTKNKHRTVSLQKEKAEKLMLALDLSKPLSKFKKRKLLRSGNLTPEQISLIKASPVQKSEQLSQPLLENKETNGNIEKKHKNKKAKFISNENEVSTLEKKKPTLSIMRLGSMKKKSYKLDKQNLVQNGQGDPTFLSTKSDVILESPSKLLFNVSPVSLNGKRKKGKKLTGIKKLKSS